MKLIFGIVLNNQFISDNMYVKIHVSDGFYSIDVESEDYLKSIKPADLIDFDKYIKTAKKMRYIYGLSFQDMFIPFDVMKWKKFPIKLIHSYANDWEIVKVLYIQHRNIFYYVESVINKLSDKLFELNELFQTKSSISNVKDLTPEMRILYSLHLFEEERKKLLLLKLAEIEFKKTFEGRLKTVIENCGGTFIDYKKVSNGYSVTWSANDDIINSLINEDFSIKELGFCCSGYDKTQSMGSAVHLLKSYHEEGAYFSKTRSIK